MTISVKGYNGQITADDEWISISHKGVLGFVSQGLKGEKRIPVASVISVQFKDATSLVNGYIQFATAGGENSRGIMSATQDENSVMFLKKQQSNFENLRTFVEAKIAQRNSSSGTVTQTESAAEQLIKLAGLLEKGLITQDEFDTQKSKLLS